MVDILLLSSSCEEGEAAGDKEDGEDAMKSEGRRVIQKQQQQRMMLNKGRTTSCIRSVQHYYLSCRVWTVVEYRDPDAWSWRGGI